MDVHVVYLLLLVFVRSEPSVSLYYSNSYHLCIRWCGKFCCHFVNDVHMCVTVCPLVISPLWFGRVLRNKGVVMGEYASDGVVSVPRWYI